MILLVFFLEAIIVITSFHFFVHFEQMITENKEMKNYYKSMEDFFGVLKEQIMVTSSYRHDLAKHIQILEAYKEISLWGQSDVLNRYLHQMKNSYQEIKKGKYCKNEVINTICDVKSKECFQKNIVFNLNVDSDFDLSMSDFEIVGLFQNLLDNSIEACERMEEESDRHIYLHLYTDHLLKGIEIKNSYSKIEGFSYETHKANPEEHGIGSKVVERIIKKNQGRKTDKVDPKKNEYSIRIVFGLSEV